MFLGNEDADPAELGHFLPHRRGEPERVVLVAQFADARDRRLLPHEIESGLGEEFLIFVQYELHGVSR